MTFIESVKIVWALQFTISAGILLYNHKVIMEEAEEQVPLPPNVINLLLFLFAVFAGWLLILMLIKEGVGIIWGRLPFCIQHPTIWFKANVLYPLYLKRRNLKALSIKIRRKIAA